MKIKELFSRIKGSLIDFFNINERYFQLILYIIIIVLINLASVTFNFKFDLTKDNIYSLTEKSKEIVTNLRENLKIRVLFTKDLPAEHSSIFRYLKDMLEEYDYYGNEYFSYEIVDEKDLERQASDFGIKPVSSRELVDDQVKLRRTYMGIVIQHADLIEKLEAVTSPEGLEYSLTSLIEKMSSKIDSLLELKKPITVELYLDSNMKYLPIDGIAGLEKKVEDAVAKCNLINYDKIKYRLIDSSVDKQFVKAAEEYGLNRLRWPAGKSKSGIMLKAGEGVLGIAVKMGDRRETIELNIVPSLLGNYVIAGLDNFEEKINNTISNLVSANQKIGYITGHGVVDINDNRTRNGAGLFKQLVSDMYQITNIDLSKESIPSDIGTIIINGPKEKFSELELFKIDQFLMMGRSAIFFIDSFREIQMSGRQNMFQRQQPIVIPVTTGLEMLLKSYGVSVNKDIVLDRNCTKITIGNNMVKDYPLIPVIRKSGFDHDNVITKYLKSAIFLKASSIDTDDEKLKDAGITKHKLVSSSEDSWLMKGRVNFHPLLMDPDRVDEFSRYNLAVLLSGKFDSYFKGKDIPVDDKKSDKSRQGSIKTIKKLNGTVKSGNTEIIVVSTSEITQSGFLLYSRKMLSRSGRDQQFSNEHLLHSFIDYLAANYYIPEMRSKSLEYNPLDKTSDRKRFVLKFVNIAGVPFIIIIMGFIIWRGRLRIKRRLKREFSGEGKDE